MFGELATLNVAYMFLERCLVDDFARMGTGMGMGSCE